jgi:ABC-type bacteriocin/lantibiotic exporter with double-glycine peptidase domain
MSRYHITPIKQPDEDSCGPAALKMALSILGKRTSVTRLRDLCETNTNGTTTRKMIRAIKKLNLPALVVEKTTLNHLLSALKTRPSQKRAVMVSYLYGIDEYDNPKPWTGHWAVVSSFKPSTSRIVLLDSYTGGKTSYTWTEFRRRWIDENLKRRKVGKRKNKFRFVHKSEKQLMIVMSTDVAHLPKFGMSSAKLISCRSQSIN